MGADSYADLVERLFVDFEHQWALADIERTVMGCRKDLDGQVPAASALEMLERLARQRLSDGHRG